MLLNTEFVITLIAVISFAPLGTFIRTGLSESIAPFQLFSLIPNIIGSFILGATKGATLKNKSINKGIGTGLCGSITTFSSFNYEFNILIINKDPNTALAMAFIAVTFSASLVAFYIGEKISEYISSKVSVSSHTRKRTQKDQIITEITMAEIKKDGNDNLENDVNEKKETMVEVSDIDKADKIGKDVEFILILKWIIFFVSMNAVVIPLCFIIDNRLWMASLFAPFGAATRWYLGLQFNKNDRFGIPIGTLIANIAASLLLTVVIVLSKESEDAQSESIWVEAITKGFCGCLSTVSSFVAELFTLQRDENNKLENDDEITCKDKMKKYKLSVIYFVVTIFIAQILSSIPNGISVWG